MPLLHKALPTDDEKIGYILMHFQSGPAASWMEAKNQQAIQHGTEINPIYGTWTDFRRDFENIFISRDQAKDAHSELFRLRQKEMNVTEFNNKFRVLVAQSGITDQDTLIFLYKLGIRYDIASTIAARAEPPRTMEDTGVHPYQIKGWYSSALKLENV